MKLIYFISALLAIILVSPSFASELTLHVWAKDSQYFQEQIMIPLRDEFATQPCQESYGDYLDKIIKKLQEVKTQFTPESFLLLHEITLVTALDLRRLNSDVQCSSTERWEHIEHHINSLMTYTNHVISISE